MILLLYYSINLFKEDSNSRNAFYYAIDLEMRDLLQSYLDSDLETKERDQEEKTKDL